VWLAAGIYLVATELHADAGPVPRPVAAIVLTDLWLTLRNRTFRMSLWATPSVSGRRVDRETERCARRGRHVLAHRACRARDVAVSLTIQEYIAIARTSSGSYSGARQDQQVLRAAELRVVVRLARVRYIACPSCCCCSCAARRSRRSHQPAELFFKHL